MDIENIISILTKLMQNNNNSPQNAPSQEPRVQDFNSSFYKLPNYDEPPVYEGTTPQPQPEQNSVNNNQLAILMELLPQILNLLKKKEPETKKRETIPSYISSLNKID